MLNSASTLERSYNAKNSMMKGIPLVVSHLTRTSPCIAGYGVYNDI